MSFLYGLEMCICCIIGINVVKSIKSHVLFIAECNLLSILIPLFVLVLLYYEERKSKTPSTLLIFYWLGVLITLGIQARTTLLIGKDSIAPTVLEFALYLLLFIIENMNMKQKQVDLNRNHHRHT